ncbi:MAG: alpha/beta hydrolase [Polaromonas sp.]|nr:alpha/beta hydrolase [Polaromonas sp.]
MKIRANNIDIEIEDSHPGDANGRPVVLLIMGLGMQLVAWPPALVQSLVDAGYRVVRLDNRDIGLSQKFDHLGMPNLLWEGLKYKLGLPVNSPYSLGDMAADTLAVLDALHIDKAHVVGVSMGGMIAQRVAIAAPQRVLSLTSIMSSSGARGLPQAKPQVMRVLMSRPAGKDPESVLNHYVKLFKAIGSPGFPTDDAELRERIAFAAKRSFYPAGTVRQMAAIAADGKRAAALGALRMPTLVIHGKADPLVPFACGEDTARRIHGAQLVGIEGMGHDLPAGVVQRILEPLVPHLNAAQATKS